MKTYFSPTYGVALMPDTSGLFYALWSARSDSVGTVQESKNIVSLVDDWEEMEFSDENMLSAKFRSNAEFSLSLISAAIELTGQHESEFALRKVAGYMPERLPVEILRSYLLTAPISNINGLKKIKDVSTNLGLLELSGVLAEVIQLQPNIKRLADAWLDVPSADFLSAGKDGTILWLGLRDSGVIFRLLCAESKTVYESVFFDLMSQAAPAFRGGINKIKSSLIDRIFGEAGRVAWVRSEPDVEHFEQEDTRTSYRPDNSVFNSIVKQKEGIISVLLTGNDAQAKNYLNDLISFQESRSERSELLKSLCDLAHRSSDVYRFDFEKICLDKAREIDPADPFLNFQFGGYCKRVGDYTGAVEFLQKAYGEGVDYKQSRSAIAGVYTQQGRYDDALSIYREIDDEDDIAIQTGIADLVRKKGEMESALKMYKHIEARLGSNDRTRSGIAQVCRATGDIITAKRIYHEVLSMHLDSKAREVHETALSGVLKQAGDFQGAYSLVDRVVARSPFNVAAKTQMASVLALLGRYVEAKACIPEGDYTFGYTQWRAVYLRGLLEMRECNDGRDYSGSFLAGLTRQSLERDERGLLRLASIVGLLSEKRYQDASAALKEVEVLNDSYLLKIKCVLDYHSAVVNDRTAMAKRLGKRIAKLASEDGGFAGVKKVVKSGDVVKIAEMQTDLFLRYAM